MSNLHWFYQVNRYRQKTADKKNSLDANLITPGMIHMVCFPSHIIPIYLPYFHYFTILL